MSELLADLAVDLIPRQAREQGRVTASEEQPHPSQQQAGHTAVLSYLPETTQGEAGWGRWGRLSPGLWGATGEGLALDTGSSGRKHVFDSNPDPCWGPRIQRWCGSCSGTQWPQPPVTTLLSSTGSIPASSLASWVTQAGEFSSLSPAHSHSSRCNFY